MEDIPERAAGCVLRPRHKLHHARLLGVVPGPTCRRRAWRQASGHSLEIDSALSQHRKRQPVAHAHGS